MTKNREGPEIDGYCCNCLPRQSGPEAYGRHQGNRDLLQRHHGRLWVPCTEKELEAREQLCKDDELWSVVCRELHEDPINVAAGLNLT